MDRLTEMEAFASVVDNGGFTEAARKLGVSKSAISKHVASLEARLGARLLDRTTRRVSPTEIGLAYYDRATQVLDEAAAADAMVTSLQSEPTGTLRLSAAIDFGAQHLPGALSGFLKKYPDLHVHMVLDNRPVDLLSDRFDAALRIGNLSDSSLRARKLTTMRMAMVASPAYLAEHGAPARIDDLTQHNLLHYSTEPSDTFWRIKSPSGETRQIRVGGRLTVNDGLSLLRSAEAGLGIAYLPSFLYYKSVAEGRLVKVLPDLPVDERNVQIVYQPGQFIQPKLRVFIDYLVEYFRTKGNEVW
jgi:DNA-binding transcriptional LysR family regulator